MKIKNIFRNIFFWKKLSPMQRRYWNLFLGAFLVIAVPLVIATLVNPGGKASAASWFNDDWGFRKAVTVTVTSNSSDITNLQTLLTVDTTGITAKLQSSCQDLRFTNTSGKLLPYYIDSCNNNSATNKIWVLADLVPKNTTTYTLYMYYGNPAAAAASNSQPYFDNVVGLVGYWTMNDGSGTTVTDSSVTGNNGSTVNSAGWTASGKFSASSSLTAASSQIISVPDNASLRPTTAITIEAWIKTSGGSTNYAAFVQKALNGASSGYQMSLATDGSGGSSDHGVRADFYTSGGTKTPENTTRVNDGAWHHIVATYNSSQAIVYVDGSPGTAVSIGGATIGTTTDVLRIGEDQCCGGRYFNGQIDDVKIYNTARTASQITNDYNNVLPNGQTMTIATTATGTIVPSTSFATEEKAPQPISWWKFDDGQGTNAQDSTTNNNDGTLSGTTKPTWQTEDMCVSGKCLYFDGSTSFINAGSSSLFAQSGDMTLSAWIKTSNSPSADVVIAGKSGDANTQYQLRMTGTDGTAGKLKFSAFNSSWYQATSTLTYNDGKWHYIAGVNSSGTLYLYVDGIQVASTPVTWGTASTGNFYIGARASTTTDLFYKGFIDDLKVYNYARSAVQVKADFNARQNPHGAAEVISQGPNNQPGALSNGLVGYWKMDESSWTNDCSTATVTDSSGNGNTGKACPATTGPTGGAAGKFGNAGSFDGSNDYVSVADNSSLKPTTITASAWVTSGSATSYKSPLMKTTNDAWTDGYGFYLESGSMCFFISHWSNNRACATFGTTTTFRLITATYDGSSIKLYIDGALSASTSTTATLSNSSSALLLGWSSSGNPTWNGKIDEARIYNRALSSAEVTQLYNFAPGPVVQLKMDEGSGTTANDTSGNANSGTINNGTWTSGKYGKGVNLNGTTGSNVSVPDFGY